MTLGVISNFASNVALRNLEFNSADTTRSVAKLSSGLRVMGASDDAAALAIGSRLRLDIVGLEQASINAGQATSLLQIADGAMARTQELLTRAKALAVQAGSLNLSDSERALIDTEFQNLLKEVDRLALDTKFNGKQILTKSSSQSISTRAGLALGDFDPRPGAPSRPDNGLFEITARNFRNEARSAGGDGAFTIQFSAGSATSPEGGEIVFTAIASAAAAGGSIGFNATIDRELILNPGNTVTADLITGTTLVFEREEIPASGHRGTNLTQFTQENAQLVFSLDETFNVATIFRNGAAGSLGTGSFTIQGGSYANLVAFSNGPGAVEEFTFKVGTGILPSEDNIDVMVGGLTRVNLGLVDQNVRTASRADAASQAIDQAFEFLIEQRADVGSNVNRLEVATENIATIRDNEEAARSRLLDLNVAAEVTKFTQQQILVQAGISTLAQANQLPQNLLRLFA